MSSLIAGRSRRSRRRLAIWLGFGVVGLSMGAVWATGFATFTGGASATPTISPPVVPGTPVEPTNPLASVVTAGPTWTVDWAGEWGSTVAAEFFQVDLSTLPAGQTYNISMLLTNGTALDADTDWQTLQLAVELVQEAPGSTCAAGDFPSTATASTPVRDFSFDSDDAAVTWNSGDSDVMTAFGASGIVGDQVYCIGIGPAAEPFTTSYTFLRDNNSTTAPTTYPDFVLTVNRAT